MSSDDQTSQGVSPNTTRILAIVLATLVALCAAIVGGLFLLRFIHRQRRTRAAPALVAKDLEAGGPVTMHRRSSSISVRTVSTATSPKQHHFTVTETSILSEKTGTDKPARKSALPEIRITFPDEVDDSGKRSPGRIVSVHITENGSEGLEPYEETLPSYQRDANDRFQSLDLERIGGLQEKTDKPRA